MKKICSLNNIHITAKLHVYFYQKHSSQCIIDKLNYNLKTTC